MRHNRFDAAAGAQMERLLEDLGRLYHERNRALRDVAAAHHEALFRLALAAEYRDGDTGVHIVRMGFLAEALALLAGETPTWSAMLRLAAPMHDVGKIGIPDAVLKKPGHLTADERAVMNDHARIGAEILGRSSIPLIQLGAQVALTHHERWDGGGYPRGLAAEQIPLAGRIVAVVDVLDALTMDRCYRRALGDDRALDLLRAQRGRAFDPRLVDLMCAHFADLVALRDRANRSGADFGALIAGPQSLAPLEAGPTEAATAAGAELARA